MDSFQDEISETEKSGGPMDEISTTTKPKKLNMIRIHFYLCICNADIFFQDSLSVHNVSDLTLVSEVETEYVSSVLLNLPMIGQNSYF